MLSPGLLVYCLSQKIRGPQHMVSSAMHGNKSETLTTVGLFAGIGGIELGLSRAGLSYSR